MLTFFRQNSVLAGILTTLLALLLRLPDYFAPHPYTFIKGAPLSTLVFNFVETLPNPALWALVFNAVLISAQALLVNYITSRHAILYKDTFLPGLMYVLLSSFFPQQSELTPQLISNIFIMLLLLRLCYLYESINPLLLMLDAGFYLGVGLLFNYDLILFLPYILISVVIFTSFNLRYLLVSLLGILLPLYLAAGIFYLTNQIDEVWLVVQHSFEKNILKAAIDKYEYLIPFALVLPITVISGFNLQQHFFRNKVKTRRIIQSVGLMLGFGVLGLFFENTNFIYALYYLNVPLSIVMGYYFISEKKFLVKEGIVLTLILLSLYFKMI